MSDIQKLEFKHTPIPDLKFTSKLKTNVGVIFIDCTLDRLISFLRNYAKDYMRDYSLENKVKFYRIDDDQILAHIYIEDIDITSEIIRLTASSRFRISNYMFNYDPSSDFYESLIEYIGEF